MIVAKGRRLVLILHLEAKYTKMDCKNEIYAKNWVRSTWTAKVNSGEKSTVNSPVKVNGQTWKVNGQIPRVKRWRQQLTQASDVSNGTTMADVSNDVNESVEAREGVWKRVNGAWNEAAARGSAWSAEQQLWTARGGVCSLRWHRGFHECVDRRRTISVVPSKT